MFLILAVPPSQLQLNTWEFYKNCISPVCRYFVAGFWEGVISTTAILCFFRVLLCALLTHFCQSQVRSPQFICLVLVILARRRRR